jgi:hypothetical protein
MKPFNGYVKINAPITGTIQYKKIENGCNVTVFEEFNSKNELLYRGRYSYDKKNDKITSYQYDSINLGKSEFFDKKITDSTTLVKKQILNFYNVLYKERDIEKITPITGIIYSSNEDDEIYSIQYKNGTAVKLFIYYDNKEFVSSNPNIPKLIKKESYNILFNENGSIYDSDLGDKTYPFIFKGEYIMWDKKGDVLVRKNLNK